jgi:hypothetical protein
MLLYVNAVITNVSLNKAHSLRTKNKFLQNRKWNGNERDVKKTIGNKKEVKRTMGNERKCKGKQKGVKR